MHTSRDPASRRPLPRGKVMLVVPQPVGPDSLLVGEEADSGDLTDLRQPSDANPGSYPDPVGDHLSAGASSFRFLGLEKNSQTLPGSAFRNCERSSAWINVEVTVCISGGSATPQFRSYSAWAGVAAGPSPGSRHPSLFGRLPARQSGAITGPNLHATTEPGSTCPTPGPRNRQLWRSQKHWRDPNHSKTSQ